MDKVKDFLIKNKRLVIFTIYIILFTMIFDATQLLIPVVLFSTIIHLLFSLKTKRRKGKTLRRLIRMFTLNMFLFLVMFMFLRLIVFYQFIYILPVIIQFSILIGVFEIVYSPVRKDEMVS